MRTLRNYDEAGRLMRSLTPFRSRVRLITRSNEFNPSLPMSGTVPCGMRDCLSVTAKGFDTRWDGNYWDRRRDNPDVEQERDRIEGTVEGFCHTTGNLPEEYHESLLAADFVVRSYATPIAWHVLAPDWNDRADVERWLNDDHPGLWIVPDVSYSLTTYQHQSEVRWALQGSWRNKLDPCPTEFLTVAGAPLAVPSGTTGVRGVPRW